MRVGRKEDILERGKIFIKSSRESNSFYLAPSFSLGRGGSFSHDSSEVFKTEKGSHSTTPHIIPRIMPLDRKEKKAPVRVFSFGDLAAGSDSEEENDVGDVSPSTRSPFSPGPPLRSSAFSPDLEETESVEDSEDWGAAPPPSHPTRFSIAYEPGDSDDEETVSESSPPPTDRLPTAGRDQEYANDDDPLDDDEGRPPRATLGYGSSEDDEEDDEEDEYSEEDEYESNPMPVGQPMLAWVPANTLGAPGAMPMYPGVVGEGGPLHMEEMETEEEEEEEDEDDDDSMEDSFQRTHPTVDPGKAQVMRSVFFPFPHQSVSQSPSAPSTTQPSDRPPRRLSDLDEATAHSPSLPPITGSTTTPTTPITSSKLPPGGSFTPLWREEAPGSDPHEESIQRLFPDEIGFPPKKRFAAFGEGGDDALTFSMKGTSPSDRSHAPVEFDLALTQQRVAWDDSTASTFAPTGDSEEQAGEQYAQSLARSFRVGWGPQQMMAFQAASLSVGEITWQSATSCTLGMDENQKQARAAHYVPLLELHRQHNAFHERGFSFIPPAEDNSPSSFTQDTVVQQARTAIHELAHIEFLPLRGSPLRVFPINGLAVSTPSSSQNSARVGRGISKKR